MAQENNKDEKEKKSFKDSGLARFLKSFFHTLVNDRKYLISFILTIFFFVLFFNSATGDSEGYFQKFENKLNGTDNTVEPTVDIGINPDNQKTDVLDVSEYVGIYSREVSLNEEVAFTDNCSISSYKVFYKVSNDKTISKYFYNDCLGTFKIWSETLKYNNSNSARYISAHEINYLFSNSGIKEIDGETYRLEENMNSIKESKIINDLYLEFYDSSVVIRSTKALVIIKGNGIVLNTLSQYKNNGGNLSTYIYKSKTEGKYKFIVFSNEEALNCYESYEESDDKLVYSIYSISYDKENSSFEKPSLVLERKVNEGCKNWQEDLKVLKS